MSLEHRRVQAQHVDGMARRGSYCAPLVLSVVRTSLLPRRPSNELTCLILIMYRHCARLLLIVPHRMLFMDGYSHCASGCRGVARCIHMAWVWPASGNGRGRSGEAGEASIDRALSVLLAAHAPPCAPRSAILSAPAACGGRGSGSFRCWRATEDGWSCGRPDIDGL